MINPVQTSISQADGNDRYLIIEPILTETGQGLKSTGLYKIYKDALGDESSLFTEPLELRENPDGLPDENNPDYLGKFQMSHDAVWTYQGDLLDVSEQEQLASFINDYREPDI